ncbi:hypothetical protein AVEN_164462-1 [Araneus ventricosus]|uniref:Uncharacterized protein n=1 Tax=Araneus ventricosus TaxID=182803 RepID=A0A4Y2Q727_ARAVE|nr:hypothetical protein AVEN_164462-1 [Araneus ventricosus]
MRQGNPNSNLWTTCTFKQFTPHTGDSDGFSHCIHSITFRAAFSINPMRAQTETPIQNASRPPKWLMRYPNWKGNEIELSTRRNNCKTYERIIKALP